jgi:uncharacterized protein (DUF1684 family)
MSVEVTRRVLACAVPLLLAALPAACGARELTHEEEIATWRVEKDRFMRESPDSPVLPGERHAFATLPYFPISAEYRIPAALQMSPTEDIIEMSTSSSQKRRMRRIGTLEFTLKGQPLRLTAFADASETDVRRLFVPFHDLTNGTETYPGGRYLDLDRTATGIYDLDFNRAYHPFCVFNPAFECPVPPRENRLAVPVRAGEKLALP